GNDSMSQCTQFTYQCSALKSRIEHPMPFLRSMGSSAELNESSFQKRLLAHTRWSPAFASMTGIGAYDERDVYKPYAGIHTNATPQNFADSKVEVKANALTGENTDFATGMPLGGARTGGTVLPGDIIVINGIPYTVLAYTSATALT